MSSTYFELGIGLALAFFLLSLLVSWVNESIVRLLTIRSKYMWAYLRDILDPPPQVGSRLPARLTDVFLKLPLNNMAGGDPRPSYKESPPPAGVTAAATSLADQLHERLREIDRPRGDRTAMSDIPGNRFALALVEMISGQSDGAFNTNVTAFLGQLKDANSPLHMPLKSLWETASGDINAFRKGIEDWFDGEMQRLTLLYRRHIRWVLTVIATGIVLLFSVDSLEYAKTLLADNAYRSEIVAVANGNPDALSKIQGQCAATATDPYACVTETLSTPAFIKVFQHGPVMVDLPLHKNPDLRWNFDTWWHRFGPGHWLGYAMTIIALLFGAPFWWDVLRRLTGVKRTNDRPRTR
jgi:hypothetical protein